MSTAAFKMRHYEHILVPDCKLPLACWHCGIVAVSKPVSAGVAAAAAAAPTAAGAGGPTKRRRGAAGAIPEVSHLRC